MSCIRCGSNLTSKGQRICRWCMDKWEERRTILYNQCVQELGEMNPLNSDAFKKRLKQLEKLTNKEE